MSGNPDTSELILEGIRGALFDLHTGLPARVLSVPESGAVDVQPLLRRTYVDELEQEQTVDLPPISRVPLLFPCGGGWSITWPIAVGDLVYLAFAERSLDAWKDAPPGSSVDPLETRYHHLSDAVAIPALRPRSSPLPRYSQSALRIGREDGSVELELTAAGLNLVGPQVKVGAGSAAMVKGEPLIQALNAIATAIGTLTPTNVSQVSTGLLATLAAAAPGILSLKGRLE